MKRVTPILVGLIVALVLLFLVRLGAGADVVGSGQENTAGMYRISRANLALQSTAGVPTVDGLYSGDEANYYVLGSADGGRGTLYYNLVGDTLYLLMRVDPSVNDNVFGDKNDPDDVAYLADAGWTSPKHRFKDLVKSDHVEFVLSCGSNSWNWKQDYADYDSGTDTWFSDYTGDDGYGTPPPGLIASASSLVWNLNNSPWDITLGGTRTSDKTYKSPFHSSTPDELPASYPGFDTDFQWEWAVIYETSIDISVCGGDDILVGVPSAHNSPPKDGTEDVPISPTVIPSSSPEPTQTPTPTPVSPPDIEISKAVDAPAGNVILVGEHVTFTIHITNTGGTTIVWLPLRDEFSSCLYYDPKSATPRESTSGTNVINWADLTTSFGQDLAPGESFEITVPFVAIQEESSATNTATVHDGLDEFDQIVPTKSDTASITCRAPASIGDYIWNDANGNGLQDEGAGYGINGVTVRLYRDDGDSNFEPGTDDVLIATQVTSGDGAYDFTMLHAGTYWVDVDEDSPALSGYTFISGTQSGPEPHLVTVSYGQDYNNADFGYAGKGNISGTVFYDWDEDGQQDVGEAGIGGVEVCLYKDDGDGTYDAGDTQQECKNTAPDGAYTFSNYLPATYFVVETQPDGLQDTTPNIRRVDLIVVGPSGSTTDNNFGDIVKGRIGDRTWIDSDGDGVQDADETNGVPNVPLHVTGVNIIHQTIDITVTTSITGHYTVADLLPGTYTVTAPASINGFVSTSGNLLSTTLTLNHTEDLTLDFGYISPTAVEVVSFTAQAYVTGVQLEWAVYLGGEPAPTFTIWRAIPGGHWKQLTPSPLGPLYISGAYAYYGFEDTNVYPGTAYDYRLEDNEGQTYGPWQVTIPEVDDGGSTLSNRRVYLPMISR